MDELILDENKLPEVQHLGVVERWRIKVMDLRMRWQKWPPRKRRALIGAGLVALLAVLAGVTWWISGSSAQSDELGLTNRNPNGLTIEEPAEPKDQESPLTGELIAASELEKIKSKRPLVVIVENHPDARPQTGLDQADLVYETLAEGGITRFVAVFWSREPEVVGPVRSIRKYFLDIAAGLGDPLIMHIGGAVSSNPEANALAEIQRYGMKSLGISGGSFWRVSSRYAPHNAYTSTKDLWAQAEELGWVGPVELGMWQFKDPQSDISSISVSEIQVNWNGWGENSWSVVWKYDAASNTYQRFHLTEPHVDAITNEQLVARNIALVYASQTLANDGTSRIVFDLIGSGKAAVIRDGKVIEGTWSKSDRSERFTFLDQNGSEIAFNRGVTWVMVVPDNSEVIYR